MSEQRGLGQKAERLARATRCTLFVQKIVANLLNERRKVVLVKMNIRSRNAMMLDVWMNVLMMRRG